MLIAYLNDLKYHTSWDWLMPVVEKIESLSGTTVLIKRIGCEIIMYGKTISKQTSDTKIEAVWLAVIEFIKWYNEKHKSK